MYFQIILIISGVIGTCAQNSHELCHSYSCFDSSDTQISVTLDGDEVYYADFTKKEIVWDSRIPVSAHITDAYLYAEHYRSLCKPQLAMWNHDKLPVKKVQPEILLYPKDEVIKDGENTLICFINHFFPPSLNITWTKNDKEATVEDPFKKCLPNFDGTFHVLSTLKFVPRDGDIYSCTVQHEALEEPGTVFYEVVTSDDPRGSGMGPTIYFVFASISGLLGVATGVFFFVKGQQQS